MEWNYHIFFIQVIKNIKENIFLSRWINRSLYEIYIKTYWKWKISYWNPVIYSLKDNQTDYFKNECVEIIGEKVGQIYEF